MNQTEIAGVLNRLCDLAEQETLPRFRAGTSVSNKQKSHYDPVTEADRLAERKIRDEIRQKYPDHGIIGEEFGPENPDAEFCWIIDPIDGTRSFITGLPLWGTLIGLYHRGKPTAGIMHQPFTAERFISTGGESFLVRTGMREELSTATTQTLSKATLMTTSPFLFGDKEIGVYRKVEKRCRMARYGADCYAYSMLAMGQVDLVIESDLNVYDIAALIPIIEGAGGIVSNWQGGSASSGGQVLASANKSLHSQALELLAAG